MADDPKDSSNFIARLLDRVHLGDREALNALLTYTEGRLRRLASRILRGFPTVRFFEQTDDVYQQAVFRLVRSLDAVQPASREQFFRLAALQIRRELLDLARHYSRKSHPRKFDPAEHQADLVLDRTAGPGDLALWTEFHEQAGELPEEERAVFDLIYYGGISQVDAAALLGVSERTVRQRWQQGRLRLMEKLGGRLPGL